MLYIFLFIMGTAIGSFSNVLIDRLANDESIMGRSHCDHCKRTLDGWDLVPILSYIVLQGKCRTCGKKLSLQYPFIEFLTGVLFVWGWMIFPSSFFDIGGTPPIISFLSSYFPHFTATLIYSMLLRGLFLALLVGIEVIFITDAKYQIIPDGMQITLAVIVALLLLVKGVTGSELLFRGASAIGVMAPILAIYIFTKGKGIGFGDVKLAATMGLLLELKGGLVALYVAFITGAIVGIFLMLMKRKGMKSKIAFGPFLLIGFLFVIFYKAPIYALIRSIYGI